jgi:hypothetical protein
MDGAASPRIRNIIDILLTTGGQRPVGTAAHITVSTSDTTFTAEPHCRSR